MPNTILNPTIIAKAAVRILDNELNIANCVYRDYESEFNNNVNGYKVGSSVSIRKPTQFTVRSGATASTQDVVEGTTTVTVSNQRGVDFQFTSQQLTLNIGELSERVLKPAMVQLANQIDRDVLNLYSKVWNYVGTPGSNVNGFASFARAAQRMDEMAVPMDDRYAFVSPADNWGAISNLTGLYIQQSAEKAYRKGSLGDVANMSVYSAQNVQTFTTGTRTNGTVNGASQNVTYSGAQANSYTQSFNVTGIGATNTVVAGDVFTVAGVFAVNPVTKAVMPYLQQFTVTANATAAAGAATLTISPPMIASGAFQTVSAAPANGAAVSWLGTASTSYAQNMAFHKNAFALTVVPMEMPAGAVTPTRQSYKGLSVRLIPYYDGTNDISNYRLDVLYGVDAIDPRLAVRFAQ